MLPQPRRNALRPCLLALAVISLGACSRNEPAGNDGGAPGAPKSVTTRALEGGAAALQSKGPLQQLEVYLDGFHFASGDLGEQMEAHHYCARMSEEFTQCVLFDGNGERAHLIGIEYIVSERLFGTLPDIEKKLWHSHVYEVKSGQLVAPGIPDAAEHELMAQVVKTYGKTWHTWDTVHGAAALPLGVPKLMMGFTADGQLDPQLVAQRDQRMQTSTAQKRERRADIPSPPILAGADAWQKGQAVKLTTEETAMNQAEPPPPRRPGRQP